MSNYQLKIIGFYNIPVGNVKKLLPKFFDNEKYVLHYENLQLYLRLRFNLKIHCVLEWLKLHVELRRNATYDKTMKNWEIELMWD